MLQTLIGIAALFGCAGIVFAAAGARIPSPAAGSTAPATCCCSMRPL